MSPGRARKRVLRVDHFEIVFVCSGNQARSPIAQGLLVRRLHTESVVVRSVGTLDVGPAPALPAAVQAAAGVGLDLTSHRARTMRTGELEGTDLVVGFEPGHVSAAVIDGWADRAKTFTLVELAMLLEGSRAEFELGAPPTTVVQRAHASRTTGFLDAPVLTDPHGRSSGFFERTLKVIDHHVATIAEVIFGVSTVPTRSI